MKKRVSRKENARSAAEFEAMKTVFGNNYLREKILNLAVHHDGNRIDRKTLVSVRQVQKSWRTTIDHRLHHLKEPLFTVKLHKNNALNGTPIAALDRFTTLLTGRDDTFSLKLGEEFFRSENYASLSSCLWRCAKGLVALELVIPKNMGSFPGVFPSGGLPNLQKLSVVFTATQLYNLEPRDEDAPSGHVTTFLGTILVQSPNLKEITVSLRLNGRVDPPAFRYLTLPANLKKLAWESPLTAEDLRTLERNPLEALTELNVKITGLPLAILFNVLSGCKDTLKELTLQCCRYQRVRLNVLKFPEMKKLERLSFCDFSVCLDGKTKANLNACFPKLEFLALKMPLTAADSWADGTRLEAVKSLAVKVLHWQMDQSGNLREAYLSTPTLMGEILGGLPCVTELSLTVDGKYPMELSPLFEKLKLITCLKIELVNGHCIDNSDLWDSLLTGLPVKVTNEIRLNPGFEEHFAITVRNDTIASIRLLKNLTTLHLMTRTNLNGHELLSRVTFKYAFLQMPKLQTLILKHRFKVSQDIAQEWEQAGRIIHQN